MTNSRYREGQNMIYYYKSHRWINGKLKKIITDEKNNIIQNPTKEQMACA